MKLNAINSLWFCTLLVLFGCAKEPGANQPGEGAGAAAAGGEKPAPFNSGPVKIALVQYSGAGDYFQQWTEGAQQQADSVGFEVQLYDAKANPAKQAEDMKAAIGSGVKGIIVDHGSADVMCPLIKQASDNGIPVVVYDVEISTCAPNAVETQQDDADMATLVLNEMAKDQGDGIAVGYVSVLGVAPFDRRDAVWKKFVAQHKWTQKFFVGKFTHDVAADNAPLVEDALKTNPGVKAIFAAYDELAKGAISAVEKKGLSQKVVVYGIDISNVDIEVMTKKDSPWKATGTADPKAVGAAVTRTLALNISGQLTSKEVVFPGALVTQTFLRENEIKNMSDLRAKLPQLNLANVSSAGWFRTLTF